MADHLVFNRLFDRCRQAELKVVVLDQVCPMCGSSPHGDRTACVRCRGRLPWGRRIEVRGRDKVMVAGEQVVDTLDDAAARIERTLRATGRLR